MTDYGIQPTGYVRKPISVILAELEAAMVTEFGPGVIQTPQTPLGQLNGLMADLLAEIDERNLDLYQSYDPDQAEGVRLDTLARLRLISRGSMSDAELRRAITNLGQARIDIQDLAQALKNLSGVTYAQVFVNDSGETENAELQRGFVAAAVIGGSDAEIAEVLRSYIVPGVSTFGNVVLNSNVNGFCRSVSIIRPTIVNVEVIVNIRLRRDRNGCPPPSIIAIKTQTLSAWEQRRQNGMDVTPYQIRSIIEGLFSTVEFVSFIASRDGGPLNLNQDILIGFTEIANLDLEVLVI
jgi:uncharacterized phage protein gp47/JayE